MPEAIAPGSVRALFEPRSSWLEGRLPPSLLGVGPWGLRWWQWLALPLLVLVAVVVGRLLAAATGRLIHRLLTRAHDGFDDQLVARSKGPLALGWASLVGFLALPWLDLPAAAARNVEGLLAALLALAFFWVVARALDGLRLTLLRGPRASAHPSAVGFIDIGVRIAKVLVAAVGVTVAMSQLGYSVSGLVAGLGIGGLAVALAFQKTGENLFGSIALGIDQPFRVGDFVIVEGVSGVVESIGLRSTRIRTLDRTLVTIPNGKLADMKIETMAARDRIRLSTRVSLACDTTPSQLRAALAGLEGVLRAHPRLWPDEVYVRLEKLHSESLDIDVMAWFSTTSYRDFLSIRQDILLGFLDAVQASGASLAVPTRTVRMVGADGEDEGAAVVLRGSDAAPAQGALGGGQPQHAGLGPAHRRPSTA